MRVAGVDQIPVKKVIESKPQSNNTSFAETLKSSLNEVNEILNEADQTAVALSLGQIENVHEAMIAAEKANLALQLTVTVRNKVIEAYQELSKMQI